MASRVDAVCDDVVVTHFPKPKVKAAVWTRVRSVSENTLVCSENEKRRASALVEQLLLEIYSTAYGTDYNSGTSGRSHKNVGYQQHQLMGRDVSELKELVVAIDRYLVRVGGSLVRRLKRRDALRRQRDARCDVIGCLLRKRVPEFSPEMRFSIEPLPGESGFSQWHSAMKMVSQLPEGIPAEFRRRMWLSLADRHLTAKGIEWSRVEHDCLSEWSHPADAELGVQIVKDLHRTGCSLFCGKDGQENQALLKRVLLAYARWNKAVGYCQGFNMLAALILQVTEKSESDALKLMIYLIEGVLPESYFADSLRGLSVDMAVFRELLRAKLPRLSRHLDTLQVASKEGTTSYEPPLTNVFTMQWFLTLFCNCLPHPTVLRVWDLILLEGNEILLRTSLAIWQVLADRIMAVKSADEFYCVMGLLMRDILEFDLIDANTLVKGIVTIGPLPELANLREHYLYNINPWGTAAPRQEDNRLKVYHKDRLVLDIGVLKKQYTKLKQRQRQAHIIFNAAVARQTTRPVPVAMNHLLLGKSALVPAKRLGPPKGAVPPARQQIQQPPRTLHWKDTRRNSSSSSSSSDTELCDDPGGGHSSDEEVPQLPVDNPVVDNNVPPQPPQPPPPVESDIFDTDLISNLVERSDSTVSEDGFDFEQFLVERVKSFKEKTSSEESIEDASEQERVKYARKNSVRALEIIQENSLILHRILQCQSRLTPSPPPLPNDEEVTPTNEDTELNLASPNVPQTFDTITTGGVLIKTSQQNDTANAKLITANLDLTKIDSNHEELLKTSRSDYAITDQTARGVPAKTTYLLSDEDGLRKSNSDSLIVIEAKKDSINKNICELETIKVFKADVAPNKMIEGRRADLKEDTGEYKTIVFEHGGHVPKWGIKEDLIEDDRANVDVILNESESGVELKLNEKQTANNKEVISGTIQTFLVEAEINLNVASYHDTNVIDNTRKSTSDTEVLSQVDDDDCVSHSRQTGDVFDGKQAQLQCLAIKEGTRKTDYFIEKYHGTKANDQHDNLSTFNIDITTRDEATREEDRLIDENRNTDSTENQSMPLNNLAVNEEKNEHANTLFAKGVSLMNDEVTIMGKEFLPHEDDNISHTKISDPVLLPVPSKVCNSKSIDDLLLKYKFCAVSFDTIETKLDEENLICLQPSRSDSTFGSKLQTKESDVGNQAGKVVNEELEMSKDKFTRDSQCQSHTISVEENRDEIDLSEHKDLQRLNNVISVDEINKDRYVMGLKKSVMPSKLISKELELQRDTRIISNKEGDNSVTMPNLRYENVINSEWFDSESKDNDGKLNKTSPASKCENVTFSELIDDEVQLLKRNLASQKLEETHPTKFASQTVQEIKSTQPGTDPQIYSSQNIATHKQLARIKHSLMCSKSVDQAYKASTSSSDFDAKFGFSASLDELFGTTTKLEHQKCSGDKEFISSSDFDKKFGFSAASDELLETTSKLEQQKCSSKKETLQSYEAIADTVDFTQSDLNKQKQIGKLEDDFQDVSKTSHTQTNDNKIEQQLQTEYLECSKTSKKQELNTEHEPESLAEFSKQFDQKNDRQNEQQHTVGELLTHDFDQNILGQATLNSPEEKTNIGYTNQMFCLGAHSKKSQQFKVEALTNDSDKESEDNKNVGFSNEFFGVDILSKQFNNQKLIKSTLQHIEEENKNISFDSKHLGLEEFHRDNIKQEINKGIESGLTVYEDKPSEGDSMKRRTVKIISKHDINEGIKSGLTDYEDELSKEGSIKRTTVFDDYSNQKELSYQQLPTGVMKDKNFKVEENWYFDNTNCRKELAERNRKISTDVKEGKRRLDEEILKIHDTESQIFKQLTEIKTIPQESNWNFQNIKKTEEECTTYEHTPNIYNFNVSKSHECDEFSSYQQFATAQDKYQEFREACDAEQDASAKQQLEDEQLRMMSAQTRRTILYDELEELKLSLSSAREKIITQAKSKEVSHKSNVKSLPEAQGIRLTSKQPLLDDTEDVNLKKENQNRFTDNNDCTNESSIDCIIVSNVEETIDPVTTGVYNSSRKAYFVDLKDCGIHDTSDSKQQLQGDSISYKTVSIVDQLKDSSSRLKSGMSETNINRKTYSVGRKDGGIDDTSNSEQPLKQDPINSKIISIPDKLKESRLKLGMSETNKNKYSAYTDDCSGDNTGEQFGNVMSLKIITGLELETTTVAKIASEIDENESTSILKPAMSTTNEGLYSVYRKDCDLGQHTISSNITSGVDQTVTPSTSKTVIKEDNQGINSVNNNDCINEGVTDSKQRVVGDPVSSKRIANVDLKAPLKPDMSEINNKILSVYDKDFSDDDDHVSHHESIQPVIEESINSKISEKATSISTQSFMRDSINSKISSEVNLNVADSISNPGINETNEKIYAVYGKDSSDDGISDTREQLKEDSMSSKTYIKVEQEITHSSSKTDICDSNQTKYASHKDCLLRNSGQQASNDSGDQQISPSTSKYDSNDSKQKLVSMKSENTLQLELSKSSLESNEISEAASSKSIIEPSAADYNLEKFRHKLGSPVAENSLIEIDKNSKYSSILEYSRNLDEKFNSLILKADHSKMLNAEGGGEARATESRSPSRIYNPFPVSISSRQNKDVAVRLGLYKK